MARIETLTLTILYEKRPDELPKEVSLDTILRALAEMIDEVPDNEYISGATLQFGEEYVIHPGRWSFYPAKEVTFESNRTRGMIALAQRLARENSLFSDVGK